ncbi:MAG: ATP-binding protein [Akkermansiaceae bacterium]|nr:ATP-binding protein [Armatimonadota bacterium]
MNHELFAPDESLIGSGAPPAPITESSVVTLTIPCAAEYVGTARLTILGVASRMGFSYDQVEDIRLAVGEACSNAIARADAVPQKSAPMITIRSHVEPTQLIVEIDDSVATSGNDNPDLDRSAGDDVNSAELGALLMEILVDEVTLQTSAGGTHVRLTKYAAMNAAG